MHRRERNGSTVLAVSVKSAIAGLVHHNFTGNSYRRKENQVACSNSILCMPWNYSEFTIKLQCYFRFTRKVDIGTISRRIVPNL